jgi:hypothetical protein
MSAMLGWSHSFYCIDGYHARLGFFFVLFGSQKASNRLIRIVFLRRIRNMRRLLKEIFNRDIF